MQSVQSVQSVQLMQQYGWVVPTGTVALLASAFGSCGVLRCVRSWRHARPRGPEDLDIFIVAAELRGTARKHAEPAMPAAERWDASPAGLTVVRGCAPHRPEQLYEKDGKRGGTEDPHQAQGL